MVDVGRTRGGYRLSPISNQVDEVMDRGGLDQDGHRGVFAAFATTPDPRLLARCSNIRLPRPTMEPLVAPRSAGRPRTTCVETA